MVHAEGVEMDVSVAVSFTQGLVSGGCGPQCGRLPDVCQVEQVRPCGERWLRLVGQPRPFFKWRLAGR